jgi:hypothetical protein
VRSLVLYVRDNGLIIALMIGTAAIVAFAVLAESMLHKLGFLALALVGVGIIAGIRWVRRHLTELAKPPETGPGGG